MDEVFKLPKPVEACFNTDCEYRVLSNPSNPGQSAGLCKIISLESGIRTGITAVDCARCRQTGEINKPLLFSKVRTLLRTQLNHLDLGFYKSHPIERTEELYRKCYKYFVDLKDQRYLASQFTLAISNGLLDSVWADGFIKTDMPDLLKVHSPDPVKPVNKEITVTVPHALLKPSPFDVNFGCCGGKSLFKLLGSERLTLTSPDGGAFSIDVKRIAGLQSLESSNIPTAKSQLQLHDGGSLFCMESTEDIAVIMKNLANASDYDTGLTSKLLNAGRSVVDVAASLYGKSVAQDVIDSRRSACESCPAVDSYDKLKLYRSIGKYHSCGRPFWKKPLRDRSVDGCGCILEIKWAGENQSCPLKEPRW